MRALETIKCVAVDDEPLALDLIQSHLSHHESFSMTERFDSPIEALTYLQEHKVDVLFLDVQMPGLSGLALLKSLDKPPLIVLTTAYSEYAIEAFELDVFDYLVKPITKNRFQKAVTKIENHFKELAEVSQLETTPDAFFVKVDRALVKIKFSEILYVQGLQKYLNIVTKDRRYVTLMTMTEMRGIVEHHRFYQTHKSYLVNLEHVDKIEGNQAFANGVEIPIAKVNKKGLLEALGL